LTSELLLAPQPATIVISVPETATMRHVREFASCFSERSAFGMGPLQIAYVV